MHPATPSGLWRDYFIWTLRSKRLPSFDGTDGNLKDYPLAALSLNLVFFAKTGYVSLDGPFSDFKSSCQFCRGYSRVRTHQGKDILLTFCLSLKCLFLLGFPYENRSIGSITFVPRTL